MSTGHRGQYHFKENHFIPLSTEAASYINSESLLPETEIIRNSLLLVRAMDEVID